jgi:hypothetical protein
VHHTIFVNHRTMGSLHDSELGPEVPDTWGTLCAIAHGDKGTADSQFLEAVSAILSIKRKSRDCFQISFRSNPILFSKDTRTSL